MSSFRLYVQNEKQWAARCNSDYLINSEATVQKLCDGIVLPLKRFTTADKIFYKGGVCDNSFRFITGLARDHRAKSNNPPYKSCLSSYRVEKKEILKRDETVIFGGLLDPTFGHFLTESISRLWYVVKYRPKTKIVFLLAMEKRNWMFDIFSLLDIPADNIEFIDRPTQFSELIIPDETLFLFSGYKKEANIIYEQIRSKALRLSSEEKGTNLYLTRSQYEKSDIINESYFESYFAQKGYNVIAPESLPLVDQISIVSKADKLASTLGTLSHFAIFLKSGAQQIILNRTNNHYLKAQIIINQLRNVSCSIVDASNNYLPVNHVGGVFLLEPTIHWARYLEDNGEIAQELSEEEKSRNAYTFLKRWHDNYIERRGSIHGLKKFEDYDLVDVLECLHLAFCGEKVRRSMFGYKCRKSDLLKKTTQVSLKTKLMTKLIKPFIFYLKKYLGK